MSADLPFLTETVWFNPTAYRIRFDVSTGPVPGPELRSPLAWTRTTCSSLRRFECCSRAKIALPNYYDEVVKATAPELVKWEDFIKEEQNKKGSL
jgi:hypothetical protein